MRQFTLDQLTGFLADHEPPCISFYQPTHRYHPENQQDPIRYRNMLTEVETSLQKKYPTREVRTILAKFEELGYDDRFWNHRTDGLAILSSLGLFEVFDLQRTVPELLVVADSFHTKPLLRILQSSDRFQILVLSRHEAKLYEGNRYSLDPVELKYVASTITEALGEELTEPHHTVSSHGGSVAGGSQAMHHTQGSKKDEVDIDRDRFFRSIDRGILEHHSRPSGLPLMLATLTEYHEPFHSLSHNPFLMPEGIRKNPDSLNLDQLREEAWKVVEPVYLQRLAKLSDDYRTACSRDIGSDDLAKIAVAAIAGRVGTLLVEDNRQIDSATGHVHWGELSDPKVDDVLDDLAELVLRMKGEVVVVPGERMPSTTGAAATYRY